MVLTIFDQKPEVAGGSICASTHLQTKLFNVCHILGCSLTNPGAGRELHKGVSR
uniref:Uncharacterized protein n=1 Tax=Helianthus annuus TaxID=4232 RepID=A0A251ST00_HELAN